MGLIQTLLYISVMNALIGLLIGILSESEGIAVLLSLLLTLPFMFLSGIFSSIKIMPRFFQWIAQAFPLNTQIELLKQVMIFGNSAFASIWYPALVLGIVVLFLLKKVKI
jgi:ABC-2 type transport system permease protein